MGFQMSLCKSHKNSLSERLLGVKSITLWDELTEHKAVSQKASFQFFMEDSYFFNIALYLLQTITLLILPEQSLWKTSWGESCNTVWSINGKQTSHSERFFPVFNVSYFLFHHSPLWTSKYHFGNPTRKVLTKGFMRGNCNSVRWFNRTQSSFSESFFSVFILGYIPFRHNPLSASNITLQIPQEQS